MTPKFLHLYELLSPEEREALRAALQQEDTAMARRARLLADQAAEALQQRAAGAPPPRFSLPGLPEGEVRKLLSFLTGRARDLICQTALARDEGLRHTIFLQELNRRNMAGSFDKYYHNAQRALSQEPFSQDRARMAYEQELAVYRLRAKFQAEKLLEAPKELMKAAEAYWELLTLQFGAMLTSICQKRGLPPPQTVLSAEKIQSPCASPLAEAYRSALLLLRQGKEADAERLAQQIAQLRQEGVPKEDEANLFHLLLNWRITQYRRNPSPAQANSLADFYAWALREDLLMENGLLPFHHVGNLMMAWFRAGREQEGLGQLPQIAARLPQELGEEVRRFYTGLAAFLREDYALAARLLSTRFQQPLLEMAARLYGWQLQASRPDEEPEMLRRKLDALIARWGRPGKGSGQEAKAYIIRAKACRLLFSGLPASQIAQELREAFPQEVLWHDSWLWQQLAKRYGISRQEVYPA
jgi:hypothetical protein